MDGEKLECALGYELVNIAGLSIEQMVRIVDTEAWYGDGQSVVCWAWVILR